MKFGFRRPSLKKRIAARTSVKRYVRHSLGLKAPRGLGWLTDPKKAAYNRVYNRTSSGCMVTLILFAAVVAALIAIYLPVVYEQGRSRDYPSSAELLVCVTRLDLSGSNPPSHDRSPAHALLVPCSFRRHRC